MPHSPTQALGAAAEDAALAYLERRGLQVLGRNFATRFGELDLVMQDGDCTAFIEVRLRKHSAFGSGADSVTAKKQQRLRRAANIFLNRFHRQLPNPVCRFDVVSISAPNYRNAYRGPAFESSERTTTDYQIEWIQDAFQ